MGALRPATALPRHGPGRRLQPHTAGSKEPAVPGVRCKRAAPGAADCHRPHGGGQGMAGRSEGSLQRRDLGLGIGRCAGRSGSQVKCCLPWTRSTSRREHRSTTGDTRRRPELGSQVTPSITSGSTSSTTTSAGKAGRATWRQRPSRDKTSPMRACECSNSRSPFVPLVRTSPSLGSKLSEATRPTRSPAAIPGTTEPGSPVPTWESRHGSWRCSTTGLSHRCRGAHPGRLFCVR